MGAFAGLLKQAGYNVRGSNQNAYPPMSDKLADWEIPVATPYDTNNLSPKPDLVIVGNVIRRTNDEATFVRKMIGHKPLFQLLFMTFFLIRLTPP